MDVLYVMENTHAPGNWVASPGFAWVLILMGVFALACNVRELCIHPRGQKRYVRLVNIMVMLYLIVIYAGFAFGHFEASMPGAILARTAILILMATNAANALIDSRR